MATKTIVKKTKAPPKERIPIIPAFGPAGCDPDEWKEYARHARIHLESGGSKWELPLGAHPWAEIPSLRIVEPRQRTQAQLNAALDHTNTRVINIQAPWGEMIVNGYKDFENRPDAFPDSGGWMIIVTSKVKYSHAEWDFRNEDIARRLKWSGATETLRFSQAELRRTEQHAIGIAKVVSVNNWNGDYPHSMKQSIWNNGDGFAWKVVEVHKFLDPVFYGNGQLGKPYFKKCSDVFKSQVRHQVSRLAVPAE